MEKHTKRYMIIFTTVRGTDVNVNRKYLDFYKKRTDVKEEFDTLEELEETLHEYIELYKDEPTPIWHNHCYVNKINLEIKDILNSSDDENDWRYQENIWDFSNGKMWWAYLILDFEESRIINYGGYAQEIYADYKKTHANRWYDRGKKVNFKTSLSWRDHFFRGDDEIPTDYKWDMGEYEGWLQYRWGDGKNALTYVEPPKEKKENKSDEASEDDLQKYVCNYDENDPNDDPNDDPNNNLNDSEYDDIEDAFIKNDIRKFKDNDPWY